MICQNAKQRGLSIRGQLLRIPVVCASEPQYSDLGLRSMLEMQHTAIITPGSMKQFLQWYGPDDASHVTVSPLLAHGFDDLPPTFFQICGRDPLRDEGLAYADALEMAGYVNLSSLHVLAHRGFFSAGFPFEWRSIPGYRMPSGYFQRYPPHR